MSRRSEAISHLIAKVVEGESAVLIGGIGKGWTMNNRVESTGERSHGNVMAQKNSRETLV
ncbi:hypothetical protein HYFRA_00004330 [Hymenoscyphus fraxineus]|uniref:Uncharacterized protein n=1 Tax=Hymenoscyphus fraxineus TaxID=746836 RepID=A0A9N9KQ34_9HELO|nr:hypothetical protein HYFRA_00004330 [Hymenoscyphus fraxineus]